MTIWKLNLAGEKKFWKSDQNIICASICSLVEPIRLWPSHLKVTLIVTFPLKGYFDCE